VLAVRGECARYSNDPGVVTGQFELIEKVVVEKRVEEGRRLELYVGAKTSANGGV